MVKKAKITKSNSERCKSYRKRLKDKEAQRLKDKIEQQLDEHVESMKNGEVDVQKFNVVQSYIKSEMHSREPMRGLADQYGDTGIDDSHFNNIWGHVSDNKPYRKTHQQHLKDIFGDRSE